MTNELSLADTDLCVMCGMCTPHCPTYHIYNTEPESPRGRIVLMQALDRGDIQPTQNVMDYLNHCTGCLACERICPSRVPFGKLMDTARQRFTRNNRGHSLKLLLKMSRHKQGLDRYQKSAQFLNQSKLIALLPPKSNTRQIIEQAQSNHLNTFYPAHGKKQGSVGLFKGCLGQTFDANTLFDAVQILNSMGLDVLIPESQYCCGALHQHNGDIHCAKQLAENNRQLFNQHNIDTIIYLASGCGSQLNNTNFSVPAVDLTSFILKSLKEHSIKFNPLQKHAVIHQACRGRNELGLDKTNEQLVSHIPELKISCTQNAGLCCGAGGGNQIEYPELANELLAIKINDLSNLQADYLISENLGCNLHFKNGLKLNRLNIEVIHPVTLLARQMI